jgi:hypothetical protein
MRPYLEKNPSPKRASGVAQGVGPEFKSQPCKKKSCQILKALFLSHLFWDMKK